MLGSSIADHLRRGAVTRPARRPRDTALSGGRLGLGRSILVSLILASVLLETLSVTAGGMFGEDFRAPIYGAARDLIHGQNPYPSPDHDFATFPAVVVMPVVLFVVAPLAVLPEMLAAGIWLGLLGAAAIATVRVLGLTDRRHMFLWLTSAPVVVGLLDGNSILFVALALALAWRHRDRPGIVAAGVTAAVTLKLWPLVFIGWLWLTGRRKAAVYAFAASCGLIFGGWGAIGFRGLATYPRMLSAMSEALAERGAWLISCLIHAGVGYTAAAATGLVVGAGLLALVSKPLAESSKFTLTTLAGVTATAGSWIYYMSLFVIPTKGRAWLLLPALWLPVEIGWFFGTGARALATVTLVTLWTVSFRVPLRRPWRVNVPPATSGRISDSTA